jgi:hypothetical protein
MAETHQQSDTTELDLDAIVTEATAQLETLVAAAANDKLQNIYQSAQAAIKLQRLEIERLRGTNQPGEPGGGTR